MVAEKGGPAWQVARMVSGIGEGWPGMRSYGLPYDVATPGASEASVPSRRGYSFVRNVFIYWSGSSRNIRDFLISLFHCSFRTNLLDIEKRGLNFLLILCILNRDTFHIWKMLV